MEPASQTCIWIHTCTHTYVHIHTYMQVGDEIVKVDGTNVTNMHMNELRSMLQGPPASPVELTLVCTHVHMCMCPMAIFLGQMTRYLHMYALWWCKILICPPPRPFNMDVCKHIDRAFVCVCMDPPESLVLVSASHLRNTCNTPNKFLLQLRKDESDQPKELVVKITRGGSPPSAPTPAAKPFFA